MKNWFALAIPFGTIFYIMFIGFPFTMKIGEIRKVDGRFQYETKSYTLVNFLIMNKGAEILCDNDKLCASVTDPKLVAPLTPIFFETCSPITETRYKVCENPELSIKIDSSIWLTSSMRRNL